MASGWLEERLATMESRSSLPSCHRDIQWEYDVRVRLRSTHNLAQNIERRSPFEACHTLVVSRASALDFTTPIINVYVKRIS
jgi:hypothetical protein